MEAGKVIKEQEKPTIFWIVSRRTRPFNITKEALQKVLKPENYVGRATEQTTEFLNGVIKPILTANEDQLGLTAEINV